MKLLECSWKYSYSHEPKTQVKAEISLACIIPNGQQGATHPIIVIIK